MPKAYRTTPIFDETTLRAALARRARHQARRLGDDTGAAKVD
jgi:hypothetical protein